MAVPDDAQKRLLWSMRDGDWHQTGDLREDLEFNQNRQVIYRMSDKDDNLLEAGLVEVREVEHPGKNAKQWRLTESGLDVVDDLESEMSRPKTLSEACEEIQVIDQRLSAAESRLGKRQALDESVEELEAEVDQLDSRLNERVDVVVERLEERAGMTVEMLEDIESRVNSVERSVDRQESTLEEIASEFDPERVRGLEQRIESLAERAGSIEDEMVQQEEVNQLRRRLESAEEGLRLGDTPLKKAVSANQSDTDTNFDGFQTLKGQLGELSDKQDSLEKQLKVIGAVVVLLMLVVLIALVVPVV